MVGSQNILGVSCYYHDSAAALLQDGVIVAAAAEERFTRIKHDSNFPQRAIEFCLQAGGITRNDVDLIVFYEKPFVKFERIIQTTLTTFPRSWRGFGEAMISWFDSKLWIKSQLQRSMGVPADRILFADHHTSHAASAFFCSPFREAALLTADGVGEWTTTASGRGIADFSGQGKSSLVLDREIRFPHSLGLLYSAFTAWLGFEVNEGEYKVMGMASYGQPRYVDRVEKLIDVAADGSFQLDMRYFSFQYSTRVAYSSRFISLFGAPRAPESPLMQYYADVAASLQRVTEDVMIRMARALHERTHLDNLCLAGGVALNSVANGRLQRETPFKQIYIQPAAGDAGGAVGAALWAYHVVLGKPRRYVMEHAFLGKSWSTGELRAALDEQRISYDEFADESALITRIVDALLEQRVVALHQGPFEWGPRALGNRSIIADPRQAEMKERVNARVKFRERFRPFGPVVLEARAPELLRGLGDAAANYPLRFMLTVAEWEEPWQARVQAVDHEGTARPQVMRPECNPVYRRTLESFAEATGVPALLNTSFNLRGEPMVASPGDALRTFLRSDLDLLVLGPFIAGRP